MEASELIGLSKQSIYKKLKAKELQEYIIKKQGMIYIDEEGFNLIKDSLKANIDDLKDFKEDINGLNFKEANSTLNEEIASDTEILSMNQDIFNLLKSQLEDKDLQIHELHKLLENSQILLKEKPQDIKLLEQHYQGLDDKIMNIKESSIPQQKRSWHNLEQILSAIYLIICLLLCLVIISNI
jgi:chromosome segregation ATPase